MNKTIKVTIPKIEGLNSIPVKEAINKTKKVIYNTTLEVCRLPLHGTNKKEINITIPETLVTKVESIESTVTKGLSTLKKGLIAFKKAVKETK